MSTKTNNFLAGLGSVLDIMPNRSRRSPSVSMPMTSDQITIKAWEMVGESFRMAMGQMNKTMEKNSSGKRS
jgi:hypothetical protein